MKKVFLLILVLAILASTCLTVVAADSFTPAHPKGYSNKDVTIAGTVDRDTMEQLCKGEDGTYSYKNLGKDLGLGLKSSEKSGALDDAAIKDVADIKYGISLIGASKLDRHISAISDTVWTAGGATLDGVAVGAGGWTLDKYFYNENGKTENDTTPNEEKGYIYTSLLTYNFGSAKQLDYMIFAPWGDNHIAGAPVAGDIYISNNSTDWTLVSYYDIAEIRTNGSYGENRAFDCFPEKYLGKDRNGGTSGDGKYGIAFCLEGINAQYLRIAFTGGRSKSSGSTYESLFNNVCGSENASGTRDILIIGDDPKPADDENIRFTYIQNTEEKDGKFDVRMIAEIDSLQYQSAGFQVELSYFTQDNTTSNATKTSGKKDYFTTTAYTSLLSITDQTSEVVTPDKEGNYFIALCITDIPVDTHVLILKITPVVTDANGQQITGESHCAVFLDGVYQTVYSLPLAF